MMEVTEQPEEQIKYPVGRKSREHGFIAIFFSEDFGVVIDPAGASLDLGESYTNQYSPNDSKYYEPVNITITG